MESTISRKSAVWLLLGMICFPGCYQPIEGCLDLEAGNFQVDADEPCPDCCSYPEMRVAMVHRMILEDTTVLFQLNTTYQDDFDQPFRVTRLEYFLQGPAWVRADGSRVEVQDSILLTRVENQSDTVIEFTRDNMILMEPTEFQPLSLGTFRASGALESFELSLGLPSEYVQVLPSSAPSGHPLASDDLWAEGEGFVQCTLTLVSGDQTKVISIRSPQPVGTGLILVDSPLSLEPGFSTEVTLQADYRQWFKGVNTVTDDAVSIADQISKNLPNSFSLVSVVTEL